MNLDWLHRNRISYKCYPCTDTPSETHDWGWVHYSGTYQRYYLFGGKVEIKTVKALYWNLSVIYHINNPPYRSTELLEGGRFINVCLFISNKENGFTRLDVSQSWVRNAAVSIMSKKKAPSNKIRYVIFKDNCGLSFSDKMSIMSEFSNKSKVSHSNIHDAMKKISSKGQKVTNKSLSLIMNCSERTVSRVMNEDLRALKKKLNDEMVQQK